MGYGLPAAMGAAVANPQVPVIDIAGDGSIQMNIQELATLSLNNIPVKIVILNNSYLGMVRQWQELFHNKRYSSTCLRVVLSVISVLEHRNARSSMFLISWHWLRAIILLLSGQRNRIRYQVFEGRAGSEGACINGIYSCARGECVSNGSGGKTS